LFSETGVEDSVNNISWWVIERCIILDLSVVGMGSVSESVVEFFVGFVGFLKGSEFLLEFLGFL
jgi:hypothetical protein